ncbi:hypothetical protein C8R43DRAFT_1118947 [Mycena crocata]|nr:hypothetical protein C8R43DRAFT_1143215 [Mycena crocata]KAJ7176420.1 hypothetical protein C8R43DRAFT_1118947 [Mycena crocata]
MYNTAVSSPSHNTSPPSALKWGKSADFAQTVIAENLKAYSDHISERASASHVPGLVDSTAEALGNLPDQDMDESIAEIDPIILAARVWEWTRIPYPLMRRIIRRLSDQLSVPISSSQIDQWILSNEKWMRDNDGVQHGLVKLSQAEILFPDSILTPLGRTITRPTSLPGFEIMCDARQGQITIQPSTESFRQAFEQMSDGLLRNLNWKNVIVAGGIMLGTLVSVALPGDGDIPKLWASSDIDMYIHGLSAAEATCKINHVYDTFRSNLPAGTGTLAVKNSKTITFYAQYPLRRIQLVLKLVRSPKDVLLNFDIDICAMGWDGTDVLMLPRAARALETGCNVFTMALIHGHYLSERRASQPTRVFKYAKKGYGLRILPSYVASLIPSATIINEISQGEELLLLDIPFLAREASEYAQKKFQQTRDVEGVPRLRYSDLDPPHGGNANIDDRVCAFESYEDEYDDNPNNVIIRPKYRWNTFFDRLAFQEHIQGTNLREVKNWTQSDSTGRLQFHGVKHGDELEEAQRVTFSSRMDVLLDNHHSIKIPVFLPCAFAVYANSMVDGLELKEAMLTPAVPEYDFTNYAGKEQEGLYMWTIGPELMWQQQDRGIDELFEVLLAFHRVNVPIAEDWQAQRLITELSKRKVQRSVEDEFRSFARWVGRPV